MVLGGFKSQMQLFTFVYLLAKWSAIECFLARGWRGFPAFSRRRGGFPFSPAEKNSILASGSFWPSWKLHLLLESKFKKKISP